MLSINKKLHDMTQSDITWYRNPIIAHGWTTRLHPNIWIWKIHQKKLSAAFWFLDYILFICIRKTIIVVKNGVFKCANIFFFKVTKQKIYNVKTKTAANRACNKRTSCEELQRDYTILLSEKRRRRLFYLCC